MSFDGVRLNSKESIGDSADLAESRSKPLRKSLEIDVYLKTFTEQEKPAIGTLDSQVTVDIKPLGEKISKFFESSLSIQWGKLLFWKPLIGEKMALQVLAKTCNQDENVKTGLLMLDHHFDYRSIRGDGHCLFRAIAAGSAYLIASGGHETADKIFTQLEQTVAHIRNKSSSSSSLLKMLADCKQALKRLGNQENFLTVEELIRDDTISDGIVCFFRALSTEYCILDESTQDSFVNGAMATSEKGTLEDYVTKMRKMSLPLALPSLGGNPEIIILAKALGVEIEIVDPEHVATNRERHTPLVFGPTDNNGKIYLLYLPKPGHYNLALKK